VGPVFEDYIEANGLSDRVKFQAGSFFDQPLLKEDVVMMGHIPHDWDLDVKRMLVRKAYKPCRRATTGADCSGWLKEAGFRETRLEHLIGPTLWLSG
jgi:hypothetical protein